MSKLDLNWDDIEERASKVLAEITCLSKAVRLYGVPRGGVYAAQAIMSQLLNAGKPCRIVSTPHACDYIVDDIVDSGKTKKDHGRSHPHIPFLALVDKQKENLKDWVVFPWEIQNAQAGPVDNVIRLIQYIGDDPNREGLKDTPERVLKSYKKLFGGYEQKIKDIITVFKDGSCDEMVVLKDVEFYSTCEHHLLPFYGKAHIAYIPNGKILGISKLARILEMYSRRLQIQERICQQITEALDEHLEPLGSACILEAQHFCMTARGVEKQHSIMITSSLTGVFKSKPEARNEFMSMVK